MKRLRSIWNLAMLGLLMSVKIPAHTQTQTDSYQSVIDIVDPNALNQELTFNNKYAEFQGDPYLLKIWGMGNVKTNQGKQIQQVDMNVDLYANQIIVRIDQKEYILSPAALISATIRMESGEELEIRRYQLPGQPEEKIVQILYHGNINLIRWEEVDVRKMENNAGGYGSSSSTAKEIQKFFRSTHYFLATPDHELPIAFDPGKKKEVIAVMNDQEAQLKTYIKQEKLKLKKDEDLVQLVQYYDTLTHQ